MIYLVLISSMNLILVIESPKPIIYPCFINIYYSKETEEEFTREEERESAIRKMKVMHERINPILTNDINDYVSKLEDPVKFNAIAIPVYTYNQGVSTKYTVNLVLFYMTVKNLGTEIHDKIKESIQHG